MFSIRVGAILAAGVVLCSCGGGSEQDASDRFVGQRAQAAAAEEAPAVSAVEAARQLMDFGEASYPSLFPGHPDTAAFGEDRFGSRSAAAIAETAAVSEAA